MKLVYKLYAIHLSRNQDLTFLGVYLKFFWGYEIVFLGVHLDFSNFLVVFFLKNLIFGGKKVKKKSFWGYEKVFWGVLKSLFRGNLLDYLGVFLKFLWGYPKSFFGGTKSIFGGKKLGVKNWG